MPRFNNIFIGQSSEMIRQLIFLSWNPFSNCMLNKIPKRFRSFYFITAVCFILWMLVLDNNDLISRFRLSAKMNSLENEREYYQEKIEEVNKDRNEVFGDKESIEKFAREKYPMKKESEDIFIVKEE